MKRLIFTVFIAMVVAFSTDLEEWNAFKLKYAKNYRNETEEKMRMGIFLENKHKIDEHNERHANGSVTFKMSLNKYSDLTSDEFSTQMGLVSVAFTQASNETTENFVGSRHQNHDHRKINAESLPDSIDWRDQGAVNDVASKRQRHCGSCWAFATTGAIEGQYFRKNGYLIRLSEQNLVDCVPRCGCHGCTKPRAFRYVQNSGIDVADNYPYIGEDGECNPKDASITISSYEKISDGSEGELTEAIATVGPIAVSIDAKHFSFRHYDQGIYFDEECSSVHHNHAVLAVGYGTDENGQDFYILKNWWGENWGENGYVRLARNQGNHCGVANRGVYPQL